jgi:hypothetical protein
VYLDGHFVTSVPGTATILAAEAPLAVPSSGRAGFARAAV